MTPQEEAEEAAVERLHLPPDNITDLAKIIDYLQLGLYTAELNEIISDHAWVLAIALRQLVACGIPREDMIEATKRLGMVREAQRSAG